MCWSLILLACNDGSSKHSSAVPMCGTVAYPPSNGYTIPPFILESSQVWSFVSAPQLNPMKISITVESPGLASGSIFVAPFAFSSSATYGQNGALIMDNDGNPIWFRPLPNPNLMNTNFKVQSLYGKPVLTYWQGTLATTPAYTNAPAGSSEPGSCYYILNNNYQVISTVTAQNGFTSDIHEFLLTPNNSALFLATKPVVLDLTPYGGPQNGIVQDFSIQEIDLATNQLIFFWDALDHIPLSDSYVSASAAATASSGGIWDAYHLNAISLTDNSNALLVSGRNTSTVYRINKLMGNIEWELGGVQSSFTIESPAQFSWQHNVTFVANNGSKQVISMFNDNCCGGAIIPPNTPYSHGMVLQLDFNNMTASLESAYYHTPNLNVPAQGSFQSLSNGNLFIGWGQSPYFSEFAAGGNTVNDTLTNLRYEATMPGSNMSYRSFRYNWIATPDYPPSIAVAESANGQTIAYVSWNGSTETSSWAVLSGNTPSNLSFTESAAKLGFETSIAVPGNASYYQVNALDASGNIIGVSPVVMNL